MYTPEEIDYEISDTSIVPEYARGPFARALSYLPEDVVDFVIENCVFISLDKSDNGVQIGINDFRLKNKRDIIFLSEMLWFKNKKAIAFVVAHEVAHAYKKHEMKDLIKDTDIALNQKREKDADKQATIWLRPHFTGSLKRYMYKDWQLRIDNNQ